VKYLIQREDRVRFSAPVREDHVELRIAPWDDDGQRLCSCTLEVDPSVEAASHRDGFGNLVHRFAVMASHTRIVTGLRAEVETLRANPFDFAPLPPGRERDWLADSLRQAPRLWDFVLHRSSFTPALPGSVGELAVPVFDTGAALMGQVQSAMAWVGDLCEFEGGNGEPQSLIEGLLETRRGVAADLVHLLIAVVRAWGVPARYALGYVDPAYFEPDEDEENGERRPETMHPWVEVLVPGAGWRGFDPAFGLLADDTYVRVAIGRDATDVVVERMSYKGEGDADPAEPETTLVVTRLS
jgi:transglutaminase-like putative cysteine protease